MRHFAYGFTDELVKLSAAPEGLHWATKTLPLIQKTMIPALFTGALGALIGSRVADDPGKGAAKGALVGGLAGMLPGGFHELFLKRYPRIGEAMLEGMPATLAGAGGGAAIGGLADEENRGRGAALGALLGGSAIGLPTYLGIAKRPPPKWYEAV